MRPFKSKGPRIRLIKARVRNGKVQRRVRKSNVKGYTLKGGILKRIGTIEHRHRSVAARRAKYKRKAKRARILIKRTRSMRRRAMLGIHENEIN